MRIVLDTNVLVSGIINPEGKPAKILNLVVNEILTLCLDSRIFSEYKLVLSSPKFSFPQKEINELLDFIHKTSIFISPIPLDVEIIDKTDLPFIEVAKSANCPVITGNKKHFRGIDVVEVLSPDEFLKKYGLYFNLNHFQVGISTTFPRKY